MSGTEEIVLLSAGQRRCAERGLLNILLPTYVQKIFSIIFQCLFNWHPPLRHAPENYVSST